METKEYSISVFGNGDICVHTEADGTLKFGGFQSINQAVAYIQGHATTLYRIAEIKLALVTMRPSFDRFEQMGRRDATELFKEYGIAAYSQRGGTKPPFLFVLFVSDSCFSKPDRAQSQKPKPELIEPSKKYSLILHKFS